MYSKHCLEGKGSTASGAELRKSIFFGGKRRRRGEGLLSGTAGEGLLSGTAGEVGIGADTAGAGTGIGISGGGKMVGGRPYFRGIVKFHY